MSFGSAPLWPDGRSERSQPRRASRNGAFDDLEEGGGVGASPYTSEIAEQENDQSLDQLEERARLIKQLTRDIHGEVESQNSFLDGLGIEMESARRMLGGTVDRFKKVFESKGNRNLATIVVCCVLFVGLLYYLARR